MKYMKQLEFEFENVDFSAEVIFDVEKAVYGQDADGNRGIVVDKVKDYHVDILRVKDGKYLPTTTSGVMTALEDAIGQMTIGDILND